MGMGCASGCLHVKVASGSTFFLKVGGFRGVGFRVYGLVVWGVGCRV